MHWWTKAVFFSVHFVMSVCLHEHWRCSCRRAVFGAGRFVSSLFTLPTLVTDAVSVRGVGVPAVLPWNAARFVICWQLWAAQWTVIMQNKVPGRPRVLRGLTSLLGCCTSWFSLGHLTMFRMTVGFGPLQTSCLILFLFCHGIASKTLFRKFSSSHSFKIFRKKKWKPIV